MDSKGSNIQGQKGCGLTCMENDTEGDKVLVVHHPYVGCGQIDWEIRAARNSNDVTVWGGASLNLGEECMSGLLRDQRESLSRFVFLPLEHKGGRMVRPYYYRRDRSTPMTFPSIKTLGYYQDCGTPLDALWIVPKLETLYLFEGEYGNSLDHWNIENGLPQRVLAESPNLKEIICAKPDFSEPFRFQALRRLVPPEPLPPDCLILMDVVSDKEVEDSCPMAMLPIALISCVVSYCHTPNWTTIDYDKN